MQGLELLRRGEASASVYIVASGGCVLRGGYVGLVPEAAGQAVVMMDLLKVKVRVLRLPLSFMLRGLIQYRRSCVFIIIYVCLRQQARQWS